MLPGEKMNDERSILQVQARTKRLAVSTPEWLKDAASILAPLTPQVRQPWGAPPVLQIQALAANSAILDWNMRSSLAWARGDFPILSASLQP